jgi:DNA repair protein RecO
VGPNFRACSICGKTKGVFDYSDKYHGILCAEDFFEDPRRLHVDPKAIHLIRLYSVINLETIGEISIKKHTQEEIKRLIDHIYDQLVGLRLKSKNLLIIFINGKTPLKKIIDNLFKKCNINDRKYFKKYGRVNVVSIVQRT